MIVASIRRGAWFLVVLGMAIQVGCSAKVPAAAKSNVGTITGHYLRYAGTNANKSPPDEATFRKFMQGIGVTDVDAVLTSSRDGKPFVVRYGVDLKGDPTKASLPPDEQPKIVILHEAQGVGGKKLTATHAGLVVEVEDPDSVK